MQAGSILPLLVVMAGGAAVALQGPVNAALGRAVGSGLAAAAISFCVGFLVLVALVFASGRGEALAGALRVPPALLIGGALGAFFVWAMLWSVPLVGVLTASAALILGQMCAALLLDWIGAFGLPRRVPDVTRIAAVALVAAGVVLSRL